MYNNNQNNFNNNQSTSKYFRITAYHPQEDITVIMDSNGKFEKLWQFSAYMIEKGFNIIDTQKEDTINDNTFRKVEYDNKHIFLIINFKM